MGLGSNFYLTTLDVVLVRTKFRVKKPITAISAAIRFMTKSKYNHVGVLVTIFNRIFVVEAAEVGIKITPYDKWASDDKYIKIRRATKRFNRKHAAEIVISYVGHVKYDFISTLFYQAIYQISGKKLWIGRRGHKAGKLLYCSEFVAMILNMIFGVFDDWYKIAPDDIDEDEEILGTLWEGNSKDLI